jgi:hypothetical protein
MSTRFVGALNLSPLLAVSFPLAELHATSEALSFRLRFGLGRVGPRTISGPWIVSRGEVASIRPIVSRFFTLTRIEFHLVDGRLWTFGPHESQEVLTCLRQLGYPVMTPTRDP